MAIDLDSSLSGFSRLPREERLRKLFQMGLLKEEEFLRLYDNKSLDADLADHFIENAIGYMELPLGIATNFRIDGVDYVIPMAVEETSIIAAASRTAKWVREHGEIITETLGNLVIGQIQIGHCQNPNATVEKLTAAKSYLLQKANAVAESLVRRGGGARDIEFRILDRADGQGKMLVLHVLADPCDAMGANIINQICEALRPEIERISEEKVQMCILSNLVDTKLTRVEVRIRNIEQSLGLGIQEASLFAESDPYRAATNNKGVLNGMDAVVVATGNDWRAVEAGVHAYAAHSGRYTSITKWRMVGSDLIGTLVAPIVVGTVGGVTKLHPTARMCIEMLNLVSASHLSRIIGAVGLVQNLGALRALSTVGIVEGHMKLHAANLALAAGAEKNEIELVRKALEEILKQRKRVSLTEAVEILEAHRRGPALSPG